MLKPRSSHPASGQLGDGRQLKYGARDVLVTLGDGDRPGAGAAADVEQSLVRAEIECLGKRGRRPGEDRLDPGGGDLL